MYMPVFKIINQNDVDRFNKKQSQYETVVAGFFMVNCPACEAFKPEWKKFVKSCDEDTNDKVLVTEVPHNFAHEVKFDTSQLDGFPTVFGKNKDDKTPKMFKGDRTQDSLKKFLKMLVEKNKHQEGGRKKKKSHIKRKTKTRKPKRKRKTRRKRKTKKHKRKRRKSRRK